MTGAKVRGGVRAAISAIAVTGLIAAGPAAGAHARKVVARGSCSGEGHWRIVLVEHRPAIGVGFQVRAGDPGDIWRVRIGHNGHLAFLGAKRTNERGWFAVRTLVRNAEGVDGFRVRAVNVHSGEVCQGRAAI